MGPCVRYSYQRQVGPMIGRCMGSKLVGRIHCTVLFYLINCNLWHCEGFHWVCFSPRVDKETIARVGSLSWSWGKMWCCGAHKPLSASLMGGGLKGVGMWQAVLRQSPWVLSYRGGGGGQYSTKYYISWCRERERDISVSKTVIGYFLMCLGYCPFFKWIWHTMDKTRLKLWLQKVVMFSCTSAILESYCKQLLLYFFVNAISIKSFDVFFVSFVWNLCLEILGGIWVFAFFPLVLRKAMYSVTCTVHCC
jgi:hypothetical protein